MSNNMIIKNYTKRGDLFIYDDVQNVMVESYPGGFTPDGKDTMIVNGCLSKVVFNEPWQGVAEYEKDENGAIVVKNAPSFFGRIIKYEKDGDHFALFVAGTAYICADGGQTIERVSP